MNLPTVLSKFLIQEDEETFYHLYSEDIRAIGELLLIFQDMRIFNYEIVHNEIIINSKIYNELMNKCFNR